MSSRMNGMVIYVARNRDMLLAVKLVEHLEVVMQRPLSKTPNKNGDYFLVVYEKNYATNLANLRSVRFTTSTYGKMESQHHTEDCPFFAKLLRDSVGNNEPFTLEELGLSKNIIQRLNQNDVTNVLELLAVRKSLLKKFSGIGKVMLVEIEQILAKHKLKLNPFN